MPRPSLVHVSVFSILLWPALASAAAPLEFDLLDDEKYAEQIVAIADLADGTFVKVLLGVSNVGPGDGKGGCTFLVVDPQGKSWRQSQIVDRKEWSYDHDRKHLQIARCSATEGNGLVVDAVLKEGSVKLRLESPAKRERARRVDIDDDFWQVDTLVRWSDCTVEITRNGKRDVLKGRGYADHPRSKIMPGKLAERWFRFRSLDEEDPRLVIIRWPHGGPPDGWHESTRGRTEIRRAMLRPAAQGKDKSWRARFKGEDGEWRVTTTRLIDRDAPIEAQGAFLGTVLGAVVGNPVTYTFHAVLVERGTRKKLKGIAEVTLTDE